MIEFKAGSIKMFDLNDLGNIEEYNIEDALITTEIDTSSLSKETLCFTHEATFEAEFIDYSPLLTSMSEIKNKLYYIEYNIPIMIQSRWHKKNRINKKWLKRYGMKKDNVKIRCDVESISPNTDYDPYHLNCLTECVEYGITLNNMQYKFRPDQLRRNLKIEVAYGM